MNELMTKEKIIIIGAGASGLMAAKQLAATYEVTILEARDEAGGRIRTSYHPGSKVEAGAEFVHGQLPLTLDLLAEAGLQYTAVDGHMFKVQEGRWQEQEEMIEGWDELLKRMSACTTDTTMQAFLAEHYAGERFAAFRKRVIAYVQGFDLADPAKVSIAYLYKEWTNEDGNNFRIDKGYAALVNFMLDACRSSGCRVLTEKIVTQVEWSPGHVQVYTAGGEQFEAAKLIVTIPLPLLQQQAIRFTPSLPGYQQAASDIGWGTVLKVTLQFTRPFWETKQKDIAFILSQEQIPTWWTQAPDQTPLLTGWLGGPPALEQASLSSAEIVALALDSLSHIFSIDLIQLQEMLVIGQAFHWIREPEALGAYSYDTPATAAARQVLNTPVQDTLYFAGEALYSGASPGTVEAAFTSGKAVAETIKSGT